jgi:phosphohistidine phosphatase SixA
MPVVFLNEPPQGNDAYRVRMASLTGNTSSQENRLSSTGSPTLNRNLKVQTMRPAHRHHTAFALAFCLLAGIATQDTNANDALWSALAEGGKVVLLRHAPVERGPNSGNPLLRDPSCRNERNLSAQGKQDAGQLGLRFKERAIPVSKVRHSPYCRTTETAQLAFGTAEPAQYLSLLEVLEPDQATEQTDTLTRLIGAFRGPGNLILVTHEPNIRAVSFELMRHLDALVIAPLGDDEYEELGVIRFVDSR